MKRNKTKNTLLDTIGTNSRLSSKPKYSKKALKEYWEAQRKKKEAKE